MKILILHQNIKNINIPTKNILNSIKEKYIMKNYVKL